MIANIKLVGYFSRTILYDSTKVDNILTLFSLVAYNFAVSHCKSYQISDMNVIKQT